MNSIAEMILRTSLAGEERPDLEFALQLGDTEVNVRGYQPQAVDGNDWVIAGLEASVSTRWGPYSEQTDFDTLVIRDTDGNEIERVSLGQVSAPPTTIYAHRFAVNLLA